MLLDKNVFPNLLALALVGIGLMLPGEAGRLVYTVGLFALSGALTNWLAVHMLFERVPGLYGSGVIPNQFDNFKGAIHTLVMRDLFHPDSVARFIGGDGDRQAIDLEPVVRNLNMDDAFDQLVAVITASSFGGMLAMVGGEKALDPLREPFKEKMGDFLVKTVSAPSFQENLRKQLGSVTGSEDFNARISSLVQARLDELTPQMVKEIVQRMIRQHLGWLVVWGAVFGGLIGLVSALFLI